MNVLLINPWIYDFAAYDLWMKPVGLLYIASLLEKLGHHVSLINCLDRYHPLLRRDFKNRLPPTRKYDCGKFFFQEVEKPDCLRRIPRKFKRFGITPQILEEELSRLNPSPEVVGITSGMTYWYLGVFEVIKTVKRKFPEVPVILGGIYATLCYEHAKFFSGADYVIQGRGEREILRILNEISGIKTNCSSEPSRFYEDGEIFPAYHLLPSVRSVAILTSRGCPFSCNYCASSLLEPLFTQRDPLKVVKEINYYIQKFKIQDIAFYDDALLVNAKEHIIPLLEEIIKSQPGVRLHTPNGLHARYIDENIALLLRRANFKTLRISFESTNPKIQKSSSGKVSNEDLIEACYNLKKAGFKPREIEVYVMVGFPDQEVEEVLETIRFVHHLQIKIKLAEFSPIPGTPLFSRIAKHFKLLQEEPLLHNNLAFPLWHSKIDYYRLEEIKREVANINCKLPE